MKSFQLSFLFKRYCTWALIILLWVFLFNVPVSHSSEELKVGVYNFEPLVFIDENGEAQGLFIDVLNYIAEKEGWKISYVPGSWNECLTRLNDGKIDLLGSIAYSEQRAKKLDFTNEFLFLDWGLVYKRKGSPIETIFDLEGKKVSVLKGSIYTIGFKKLLEQFGIKSTLLEKDEYTQVFESIEDDEADAGINAQVYGMRIESDYEIERTQIFFSPVKIRFAVPKGEQQFILNKLDEYFSALKADKQSHYYTLFNKWMGLYSKKKMFPRWVKGVLIAIVPIFFILTAFNLLLKKEVERKTSELLSADDDLRESEERFRSTFEQAAVGIAHVALDGRFLRINQRFCDIVEYTPKEMLAHTFQDITYPDDLDADLEYVHQVLSGEIQTYSLEKRYFKKNGSIVWVNLTVSLVRESSGEPKHFIGVVEDITERKQIEKELQKAHDELERRVEERTAELSKTNEKLKQENQERKRADEALQESEAKYRALFENMIDGVAVYESKDDGKDFVFVGLNKAGEKMSDITRDAVIGQSVLKAFPGVKDFGLFEVFQRVWKTGMPARHPVSHYKDDRVSQWVDNSVFKLPSGEIVAVYSDETERMQAEEALTKAHDELEQRVEERTAELTHANISLKMEIGERKAAMEALKASEKRFQQVAEYMEEWVWEVDANGLYTYASPIVEKMLGYKPEEIVGRKHFYDLFHSEDMERVKNAAFEVFARKETFFEFINKNIHKNGNTVSLSTSGVPILDREGNLLGYRGADTDVSERTRMEEMLRESEEQHRNLVETSQDLIWKCNSEGCFTYLNPACESILGYRVEEMLGCHFNEFKPPEIAARDLEVFRKILKGKDFFGYETIYISKTGEQKNLVFNAQILKDADGNIIGTQGTAHDITERKRAEEEKANLKAQLVQVQKMEAIGTLAGGIAHDFNNILSSVLGFAELAKMNLATGKDAENDLDEVMNAGLRARDLVKHILTFSRKADVQKQPTQIRLLIKEALKFLRASLPTTIEVRSDLGVSDSTVMADPTQIHQILMNLCTNAAHAMQEKGGVLDVRMEEVMLEEEKLLQFKDLKHGKYIRLTVGDTGHGIPKEIIDRIFDPFFTTKERSEGTGMGLATVHGIVKDMGGTISVYSELGKGTTFDILFPKHEGEAADLTSPRYILKKGKGRILFVDDEKGIVVSGRQILERLGYEVVATTSSLEALKLFESGSDTLNLVLTDMTMPAMTGLELSKKLTEIRPDIPIVLCTGFSTGITTETIRDAGIREMIKKPMIASELAEAVEKALKP